MPQKSDHRSVKELPVFLFVLSLFSLFFVSMSAITALSQTHDNSRKKITRPAAFTFKNEPIQILKVSANGKDINFDEEFPGGTDWFKDFSIKFKNVSGRTITCIGMGLIFLESNIGSRPIDSYALTYGIPPLSKNNELHPERSKSFANGDTDEIILDRPTYEALKRSLSTKVNPDDISTVIFTLQVVYFDDGMKWNAGDLFRPDPNFPNHYLPAKDPLIGRPND